MCEYGNKLQVREGRNSLEFSILKGQVGEENGAMAKLPVAPSAWKYEICTQSFTKTSLKLCSAVVLHQYLLKPMFFVDSSDLDSDFNRPVISYLCHSKKKIESNIVHV